MYCGKLKSAWNRANANADAGLRHGPVLIVTYCPPAINYDAMYDDAMTRAFLTLSLEYLSFSSVEIMKKRTKTKVPSVSDRHDWKVFQLLRSFGKAS